MCTIHNCGTQNKHGDGNKNGTGDENKTNWQLLTKYYIDLRTRQKRQNERRIGREKPTQKHKRKQQQHQKRNHCDFLST